MCREILNSKVWISRLISYILFRYGSSNFDENREKVHLRYVLVKIVASRVEISSRSARAATNTYNRRHNIRVPFLGSRLYNYLQLTLAPSSLLDVLQFTSLTLLQGIWTKWIFLGTSSCKKNWKFSDRKSLPGWLGKLKKISKKLGEVWNDIFRLKRNMRILYREKIK